MIGDDDDQSRLQDAYDKGVAAGTNDGFRRGFRTAWTQIAVLCREVGNTDGADFAHGVLELAQAQDDADAAPYANGGGHAPL